MLNKPMVLPNLLGSACSGYFLGIASYYNQYYNPSICIEQN